jgi:hypothetical protein
MDLATVKNSNVLNKRLNKLINIAGYLIIDRRETPNFLKTELLSFVGFYFSVTKIER